MDQYGLSCCVVHVYTWNVCGYLLFPLYVWHSAKKSSNLVNIGFHLVISPTHCWHTCSHQVLLENHPTYTAHAPWLCTGFVAVALVEIANFHLQFFLSN